MKLDIANPRSSPGFLSVVMFLTTIAPPVWTHCHQDCSSGGEECCADQHESEADDGTCCRDRTAHCSVELKHPHDGAESFCWSIDCNRNFSHGHLAWLGMTARVPVDEQSKQLNGGGPNTAFLHAAVVFLKESGSSTCELPVDLKASNVIGHALPQSGDRTELPPNSLLCDVARRERTGVLVV
jgi:hypothetical protein